MPTGYKVGGIILLAAGTYYLISAAVADSVNMPQYRTAWIVMGAGGVAAGSLVLNAGHRKGAPSLVFSGRGVELRSAIALGKRRPAR